MAVPPPSDYDKTALRKRLRAARARFVAEEDVAAGARAIAARLGPLIGDGDIVAGHVSHRGEPDIAPFLLDLLRKGHPIALPRMDGGRMRFVSWHPEAALAAGPAGIAEPIGGEEVVPDTLLVPLIGFDRSGSRLGQGAGCYDRWLAAHPGVRAIGIAWSVQEADGIPADPWDVSLDAIVTEREWIAP